MAKRGTSKRKSQDHEHYVARCLDGTVSPSSGAAVTDAGDVRTPTTLVECKIEGGWNDPKRPSLNKILGWLVGIFEEAVEEGRDPALALRLHAPDHPMAHDGWLDLILTDVSAFGAREYSFNHPEDVGG